MLCWHSFAGVAPGGAAQSRGDGVGSVQQSAQALQSGWKPRGGLSCTRRVLLVVKLPSGGFGHQEARVFLIVLTQRPPQRRRGTIKEAVHPRALTARIVIVAGRFAQGWFLDGRLL